VEVEVGEALSTSVAPELVVDQPTYGDLLVEEDSGCATLEPSAYVDVYMGLGGVDARVSRDLFHFSTIVDDEPWRPESNACSPVEPGSSWLWRGGDRVAASCNESFRTLLAPGRHRVRMEARLPGTDIVYATDEVSVDLECPQQPGAEVDAGSSGRERTDASTIDAGTRGPASGSEVTEQNPDTQAHPEAEQGDNHDASEASDPDSTDDKTQRDASARPPINVSSLSTGGGGGCALSRATPSAPRTHALWLLALVAMLVRRRTNRPGVPSRVRL
jgi:hypothetical protein